MNTMNNNTGTTDLDTLIRNMEPVLHDGEYVFVTTQNVETIPRNITVCEMKEKEGTTLVLSKSDADSYGLEYSFVSAWITLNIHSALEAVGLTAAFSTALGNHDISCNVIAGFYHDHIFVSTDDKERAIQVLKTMSENIK